MPVSDLVRLGTARPTNQQLADMALEQDQAARRALSADNPMPDLVVAAQALAERDALCGLLR